MPATPDAAEIGHAGLAPRTLARLTFALLALGLVWRTLRYLLVFPIWGDEALLALNFIRSDYRDLAQRLENCQIAPVLFLWTERAAFVHLGPGELSLRLAPFAAGVAGLFLFWRLAGLVVGPLARLFAVGFLAVAIWPVSMCTLIKPYSFDLLMPLLLLLPAARWLKTPHQTRWLATLTAVTPLALLASNPAVFVAGGVWLALARTVWNRGWAARGWFAAFGVAMLVGFGLAYQVGLGQLGTPAAGADTRGGMTAYWSNGFPPPSPLAFARWFALETTGQMTAYPVGSASGGSVVTVAFILLGAARWWRDGRSAWLTLCLAPVGLSLVASALHAYPYGNSGRLNQYLAPGFCLLAGLGVASAIDRAEKRSATGRRWALVAVGVFALVGVGGMARDVMNPYREPGYEWMRATMAAIRAEVPAGDPVVVTGDRPLLDVVFVWYWENEGDRVSWNGRPSDDALKGNRLWAFHYGPAADLHRQLLGEELARDDAGWRLVKTTTFDYRPARSKERPLTCELCYYERTRHD